MRFSQLAAIAATFVVAGCGKPTMLPDTLMFPPGVDIHYQNQPAKLYGTAQCAQGKLAGNSCLIFPPENPQAIGIVITADNVYQIPLTARRDPNDPIRFLIEDDKGQRLLSTTGRHDEHANIDIAP